jgi:hypothetical protein
VRNDDTSSREVLVEHPFRADWELAKDGPEPEEIASNVERFRVSVDPKVTKKLELTEAQPLESRFELTNLDDGQITLFLREKSITPEVEAAFRKILTQKALVAELDDESEKNGEATSKIFDDQQRLRENLKALKGSAEERALTQRYTQQLADQETQLAKLNQKEEDLQAKSDQAKKDLDDMIRSLTLDTTL